MSTIYIDTTALANEAKRFENMSAEMGAAVDDVLNTNAEEMAGTAKQLASQQALSYKGRMIPSITADLHDFLKKNVGVGTDYAAYVEFGTGVYAAQYVGALPADWQQFAQQFKGKTSGTFSDLIDKMKEWVRLKGIATGKDIDSAAYLIARSILMNGVKPQPFIYPAYQQQISQLEKDLHTALDTIK